MSGNCYKPHPLMIHSGQFWRCDHGSTGLGESLKFIGCPECKKEIDLEQAPASHGLKPFDKADISLLYDYVTDLLMHVRGKCAYNYEEGLEGMKKRLFDAMWAEVDAQRAPVAGGVTEAERDWVEKNTYWETAESRDKGLEIIRRLSGSLQVEAGEDSPEPKLLCPCGEDAWSDHKCRHTAPQKPAPGQVWCYADYPIQEPLLILEIDYEKGVVNCEHGWKWNGENQPFPNLVCLRPLSSFGANHGFKFVAASVDEYKTLTVAPLEGETPDVSAKEALRVIESAESDKALTKFEHAAQTLAVSYRAMERRLRAQQKEGGGLEESLALLIEQFEGIVSADYRQWFDGANNPEEFVRWAKSRAAFCLERIAALRSRLPAEPKKEA